MHNEAITGATDSGVKLKSTATAFSKRSLPKQNQRYAMKFLTPVNGKLLLNHHYESVLCPTGR